MPEPAWHHSELYLLPSTPRSHRLAAILDNAFTAKRKKGAGGTCGGWLDTAGMVTRDKEPAISVEVQW